MNRSCKPTIGLLCQLAVLVFALCRVGLAQPFALPREPALGNEEVVLTLSSNSGEEYLKTSFGRSPSGELLPDCIEDKKIPLPIRGFRAEISFEGVSVDTSSGKELLFAPKDPVAAAESLVVDDLVISNGPMAGTWKYRSAKSLEDKGVFVQWSRDHSSYVQTFIPWAAIGGAGISRSQFDAPLCRQ